MDLPDKSTIALVGVLISAVTWTISGVWALWVRRGELDASRWKRLGELSHILNRGDANGLWAQISAAHELACFSGEQGTIALDILEHAQEVWRENDRASPKLRQAIDSALSKAKKRNKLKNIQLI